MKPTRPALALVGLVTAAIAVAAVSAASAVDPVSAHLQRPLAGVDSGTFPGSEVPLGDRDNRGPRKAALRGAVDAVAGLGGGVSVSWKQYGTPRTLTRPGGGSPPASPGRRRTRPAPPSTAVRTTSSRPTSRALSHRT